MSYAAVGLGVGFSFEGEAGCGSSGCSGSSGATVPSKTASDGTTHPNWDAGIKCPSGEVVHWVSTGVTKKYGQLIGQQWMAACMKLCPPDTIPVAAGICKPKKLFDIPLSPPPPPPPPAPKLPTAYRAKTPACQVYYLQIQTCIDNPKGRNCAAIMEPKRVARITSGCGLTFKRPRRPLRVTDKATACARDVKFIQDCLDNPASNKNCATIANPTRIGRIASYCGATFKYPQLPGEPGLPGGAELPEEAAPPEEKKSFAVWGILLVLAAAAGGYGLYRYSKKGKAA